MLASLQRRENKRLVVSCRFLETAANSFSREAIHVELGTYLSKTYVDRPIPVLPVELHVGHSEAETRTDESPRYKKLGTIVASTDVFDGGVPHQLFPHGLAGRTTKLCEGFGVTNLAVGSL